MEIEITSATHGDLHTIADFQMKMAHETEDLVLDRHILEKGIEAVLDDPTKAVYFIARAIESHPAVPVPAGMLMITLEWSDWRNGWVWWIQSVFVGEQYRKAGVFRKLYEHVKEMVIANNDIKGLRLYVDKRNHKAQKVYESLGMTGEHYTTYEWMK